MIHIAWYNLVAIIFGIIVVVGYVKFEIEARKGAGFVAAFRAGLAQIGIIILTLLFYSLWGGIFWW